MELYHVEPDELLPGNWVVADNSHGVDSESYCTRSEAEFEARRLNIAVREWHNAPACDAPHMDGYMDG
jgi:hypothetical protein